MKLAQYYLFQQPIMEEKIAVVKLNCGQIFLMSDENFSFSCKFCDRDFYSLQDFLPHIKEHCPKSVTKIKRESGSDNGSMKTPTDMDTTDHIPASPAHIKNEDSIGCDSECEESFIDNLQDFAGSQSTEYTNQCTTNTSKSKP